MKKIIDKKESLLVLVIISIFVLIILGFSINIINKVKDLTLQANLSSINTLILEYYLERNSFPEENNCNIKEDCFNLKKKILTLFTKDDIYYNSNGKDYILYSPSFINNKMYFLTGSDLLIEKVLEIPKL